MVPAARTRKVRARVRSSTDIVLILARCFVDICCCWLQSCAL
jgi:hypothetical protein